MIVLTCHLCPMVSMATLVFCVGNDVPSPLVPSLLPAQRGSDEFREWVRRHQLDPAKPLADLSRELDRMTASERKNFDRQSQSRVGYLDVRAELEALQTARGPDATIRDVIGVSPGGR
jgi:hypothetical protein